MADADAPSSSAGSPFWRFSLGFYRRPNVGAACIEIQDQTGVDVNLLLFLLWNASLHRRLSADEVRGLERRVADWRDGVVIRLRELRRALKSPPALVPPGTAELFRTKVKAIELEAERLQQEALYAVAQSAVLGEAASSSAQAARDNIAAYQAILPRPFSPTAVDTLLSAFAAMNPAHGVLQEPSACSTERKANEK
jgi:uncharacterized protein (TIGR02444 family)